MINRSTVSTLRRSWPMVVLVVLGLIALIAYGSRGGGDGAAEPTRTYATTTDQGAWSPSPSGGSSTGRGTDGATRSTEGPERSDGYATVAAADLPPEARETMRLIERDGPFPYRQDGSVFGNRERLLPIEPRGYYREYTVRTPGENDRGARRIVAARNGTLYYTDDHYDSFRRIVSENR
ncbi:ribonuclease domain-containing protein [Barrientosiimonas humi]|uniref:ribonuclease domain-containing protein n=1 Tax=Barrientosiimonas humi TaxID=999931 RepID=UPI00370D921D